MSESLFEILLSLAVALASLASVAWVVVSGLIAFMDGIAFALIALTIGVFFLFNIYLAYRSGDLQKALKSGESKKPDSRSQPGA